MKRESFPAAHQSRLKTEAQHAPSWNSQKRSLLSTIAISFFVIVDESWPNLCSAFRKDSTSLPLRGLSSEFYSFCLYKFKDKWTRHKVVWGLSCISSVQFSRSVVSDSLKYIWGGWGWHEGDGGKQYAFYSVLWGKMWTKTASVLPNTS